jgi:Flp pilus assembly pilin Flp
VRLVHRLVREEQGAETVEYALVIGLMALAAVAGIGAAGSATSTLWQGLSNRIGTLLNPA